MWGVWSCALLLTVAVAAQPHPAPNPPAQAIETPRPDWQVLHCGVSRGVLYLTYAERGQAFITPAQPNDAVQRACERAGHPVADRVPVRTPQALPPVTVWPPGSLGDRPPGAAPGAGGPRPPPGTAAFTAQALGPTLSIDGRNDGDSPVRCSVSFSWMADGDTLPRADGAQVTLAPRQADRVVTRSAAQGGVRFVDPPRWTCSAVP